MAVEASFFIGENSLDEENDSDSLSSDSEEAAEDTDSLSSLDSDGMSCTSIDSMDSSVHPDSENGEEDHLPSSVVSKEMKIRGETKSRREYPISPEMQATLPNFFQVPTGQRGAMTKGEWSSGSPEHAVFFSGAPPPPSSCSVRNNSAFSRCSVSDSNAIMLLDETCPAPKV